MNPLFRRPSYSLSSSSAKRVLSYLLFAEHIGSPSAVISHQPSLSALPTETRDNLGFGLRWRGFSSGTSALGFRATDGLAAQPAIDDYMYDEKTQGNGGEDEGLDIAKLGIAEVIVMELAKKGITKLFPIQRAVLEPAMEGRDMIGRARTGTGKTLAFGIPIMDKIIKFNIKHGRGRNPLALVLAPTRELAKQVEKEFKESSDLDTICVYGGSPIAQQMSVLDYGVDVIVGTPGRVIDLLKRGALNLSEVQFVVLDEADQMLAVGFADDVETILDKLPPKRQSMMFSATMPSWIRQLTRKYLVDPLTIDLVGDSDQKLAEGITLYSIVSENHGKASIIGPLVSEHAKGGKCIIFTQTKRDADRLSYSLGRNLKCEALHGDISQAQREKTLSGFREGHFNVLVATDVAARGLDIPNVDLVIHYELPNSSEIFVHRSGRTGRAGKKGSAILIHTEFQVREIRTIEQHVGCKFTALPKIIVESGAGNDMFTDMGSSRFGSNGRPRMGGSGFRRMGGSGSGYGGSSRFGRHGDSGSGRSNIFGGSRSGSSKTGGFGQSGDFGGSGRSSGFGDSGRFGDSSQPRGIGISNSGSKSSDSSRFGRSSSSRFTFND